jgi:hypothetical protein
MLLRRIIEHVKAQNWFAVGLDFVIVVAGVFIGLQVQQWNETRKDTVQHEKLLERLEDEFRDLEPVAAELVAFLHTSRKSTADVIDALRREQPPEDEAVFRFALARANWVMNFPDIATAYEELVATGRLSEIRSIELRKALIGYGDAHERLERVHPGATSVIFAPDSNYYRAVDWNMDPDTWATEGAILSYDWETLRASRAEMQAWVSFQYDLAMYAERELEQIRAILSILERDPQRRAAVSQ